MQEGKMKKEALVSGLDRGWMKMMLFSDIQSRIEAVSGWGKGRL